MLSPASVRNTRRCDEMSEVRTPETERTSFSDAKRRMEMDGLRLLVRARFAKEIEEKRIALELRAARYENQTLRRELDLAKREFLIENDSIPNPNSIDVSVQTSIAGLHLTLRGTCRRLFPPIWVLLSLLFLFSLSAAFLAFLFSSEIPSPDPATTRPFFSPDFFSKHESNSTMATFHHFSSLVPEYLGKITNSHLSTTATNMLLSAARGASNYLDDSSSNSDIPTAQKSLSAKSLISAAASSLPS